MAEVQEVVRRKKHTLEGRAPGVEQAEEEQNATVLHFGREPLPEVREALKKPNTLRKYKAVLDRFVEFLPANAGPNGQPCPGCNFIVTRSSGTLASDCSSASHVSSRNESSRNRVLSRESVQARDARYPIHVHYVATETPDLNIERSAKGAAGVATEFRNRTSGGAVRAVSQLQSGFLAPLIGPRCWTIPAGKRRPAPRLNPENLLAVSRCAAWAQKILDDLSYIVQFSQ